MIRAVVLLAVVLTTSPALAQIERFSCDQLWFGRNSVFKMAGYCFKTPRAIQVFGNAGCLYGSEYHVPLSAENRNLLAAIRQAERYRGCSG
jgi:YARHG domain